MNAAHYGKLSYQMFALVASLAY